MDSVVSIVQLFNNLWECCAPDLSYIEDIPRKVQELSDLVGDLKAMKADVNREVEKDRREPTAQGKRWLERANSIIGFADATIAEGRAAIEKDDKRSCPCFGSCCLNFSSRYQMGKDIVEATKVVTSHKEERRVLQLFHDFPKKRRVVLDDQRGWQRKMRSRSPASRPVEVPPLYRPRQSAHDGKIDSSVEAAPTRLGDEEEPSKHQTQPLDI